MRRHLKAVFVVAALCSFFAVGAPAALGAYVEVGSFAGGGAGPGGSGSGNGQLAKPGQADVNDATGNLYVADTGNNRVQVFKPTATAGEYDSQAAVPGAKGLAINQSDGSVYVATATGIAKLTAALAPAPGWTDPAVTGALAVDPATGDVLVADTAGNLIRRFNSDGSADGSFAAARPIDVAANSEGDVFVVTTTGDIGNSPCGSTSAVERFSGAGASEGTLPSLSVPGAVAVDPDDDSIMVATHVNEYFCEQGDRPGISSFDASGSFEGAIELAPNTMYASVPGLAVRGDDSSRAYVVTKSPMNDSYGATKVTVLEVPPPVAPAVVGQWVLRGTIDATLRARVNAGGAPTEYHFEYGTTAAYGGETAPETLLGSFDPVTVSAGISGLAPGTTYHYRVVVSNSEGEVQGADSTFTTVSGAGDCPNEAFRTGPSAHLTDCRAYELVTPRGSDADIRIVGGPTTPDGNAVCFATEDQLLDADPNGIKTADQGFCSWRRAGGWETKWVTGPASPTPGVYSLGANVYFLSPDGQRAVFATDGILFGQDYIPARDASHGGQVSAYLWEAGETTWLSPAGPGVGDPPVYSGALDLAGAQRRPLATSDDLTRGIFQTARRVLPADENNVVDLYEWFPGGVRLLSTDPSGKAAGGTIALQPTFIEAGDFVSGNGEQIAAPAGTMSADGSRVFFQHGGAPLAGDATEAPEGIDKENLSPLPIQSVYMREGDEITLVSPRRGSGPNASVWFVGASADGEVAYVESRQQLTPEAKETGRAIYRYDVEEGELELLLTAPGGVKAMNVSRDGSTVVFRERVSDDLIVSRGGVETTLGSLAEADLESEQGAGNPREDQRRLRVSPDGRVVVFAAAGEFGGFGPGPVQVYRWETGEGLDRISAPAGSAPDQNASITAYNTVFGPRSDFFHNHTNRANSGRVMSDDGSRVFFETPEALANRDVNGVTDVYEWHDGEISLVSSGTGVASLYHGNSADGRTVFISTFDRLLPEWDRNAKRDLYAATPDGGFAPPPPPPSCQGESCQPSQGAPLPATPGRESGAGNLRRGLASVGLAEGGEVIRVGVLVPGKVTAKLSGKLGKGGPVRVAKATRVASQAGPLRLPVRLSGRAKRLLAERGRLTLTLAVTHAQSEQTITRKVTLHG